MQDSEILTFSIVQLLDKETLLDLYTETDEERARLKALMIARAKELDIEKEIKAMLSAYDKADRALANEYTRKNAIANSPIQLKFDGKGSPLPTIENFLMIVRNDPFFAGLKFNLLSYSPEIEVDGETIRWTDADDSRARFYIEQKYKIHNVQKLDDALRIIFGEREYHPIIDMINSIEWDGIERVETFLSKWMKTEDSPYSREVSRLIFAGGIHRLYHPGCKFDDVPVLIGTKQGEGKSTFVRWLAMKDDFFTEITEIEGQRGIEALEGAWICEIAELLALTKTKEVEAVKSYITKISDKYRKPFDRRVTEHKRQCVFIGTTNKEQFLTDKTGNRRFYPIKVNQSGYELFANKDEIQMEILQCWAEAKTKMEAGNMPPFADSKIVGLIRERQQDAVEDDYREGLIQSYLEKKDEVCILEIWKDALGYEFGKPNKKESNEISLILQGFSEWEKVVKAVRTENYGVQKIWRRLNCTRNAYDYSEELPF